MRAAVVTEQTHSLETHLDATRPLTLSARARERPILPTRPSGFSCGIGLTMNMTVRLESV